VPLKSGTKAYSRHDGFGERGWSKRNPKPKHERLYARHGTRKSKLPKSGCLMVIRAGFRQGGTREPGKASHIIISTLKSRNPAGRALGSGEAWDQIGGHSDRHQARVMVYDGLMWVGWIFLPSGCQPPCTMARIWGVLTSWSRGVLSLFHQGSEKDEQPSGNPFLDAQLELTGSQVTSVLAASMSPQERVLSTCHL
jgi:hypothetical protein